MGVSLLSENENIVNDQAKTKKELINEVLELRQELEALKIFRETANQQAEILARESEEKYRVLFEESTKGVLTLDIETQRFLYSNPAIRQMLGYTEDELHRLKITDLHPKDELNDVMSKFESPLLGEKPTSFAIPCWRKDGTVFYADIAGAATTIKARKCVIGLFYTFHRRKNH